MSDQNKSPQKEENPYKVSYWQMFSRLPKVYKFMREYKGIVFFTLFINLISTILISVPPLLVRYTVDDLIPIKDLATINIIFLYAVAILITIAGIRVANVFIRRYLGAMINYDIRKALFDALLVQSPKFFSKRVSGEITSRLNNDAGSVEYLASQALFDLSGTFMRIAASLTFLFILSWKLTILVLIMTFLMYINVTIVMNFFKKYRKIISEKWGRLLGYMQEIMSNVKIVMAFGNENREGINHVKKSREYIKDNIKFGIIDRMFGVIGTLFYYLFQVGVIVYGVHLLQEDAISIGLLLAFIMYINNFFGPIFGLSGTMTFVISSFVSVDRIYSYIEEKNEIEEAKNPITLDLTKCKIEFKDVRFSYKSEDDERGGKEKEVLQGLNLTINDGESVALVGHSGAGKSTIINLLLRFYDPQQGTISFNDVDLKQVKLQDYRDLSSMVFQDALLFNDTIYNNIAYSKPDATPIEIDEACRNANIYDFVMSLPHKYDTIIGERGLKLSGGQRQRLSIARAVLKNPKLLILDEATASVDSISENAIQKALDKIMIGRTTIVIAHRLTTIINVDKIVVLDKGVVKEQGSHRELLAKEGLYYKLWTTQMEEAMKQKELATL